MSSVISDAAAEDSFPSSAAFLGEILSKKKANGIYVGGWPDLYRA